MTLCVAWKRKLDPTVRLASDSRISIPGATSDHGIKIFQVPVKIFEPRDSGTGKQPLIFQATYGLGFAGPFLAVQVLREFLFIVLQRLCAISDDSCYSFDGICAIVHKYVTHLSEKLSRELDGDYALEFFLCGNCPRTQEVRLAKFWKMPGRYEYKIYHEAEYTLAIGSGKSTFSNLFSGKKEFDAKEIIRAFDMVAEKEPCVGGNVQYGYFENNSNFQIAGMTRCLKDEYGNIGYQYFFSGIEMTGREFFPKPDEFFVIGNFIDVSDPDRGN